MGAVRPDGWNETHGYGRIVAASGPGSIRGLARSPGDPVPGAPVYLKGYDSPALMRAARITSPDLAPGSYRILSTFEYLAPDVATMDITGARSLTVNAHAELGADLDLYVTR